MDRKKPTHTRKSFMRPARKMIVNFTAILVVIAIRIASAATLIEKVPALVNSETENVTALKLAIPPNADVA